MNEKTLQALTELANRLGTTTEYLWGVLLKQAPISGIIDLVFMTILIVVSVLLIQFVIRKTTKPKETEAYHDPGAEWAEEAAVLAWILVFTFLLFITAFVLFNFSTAITAMVHPEYWALHQILNMR